MRKLFKHVFAFLLFATLALVLAGCKSKAQKRMDELLKKIPAYADVTEITSLPKYLDSNHDHVVSYTSANEGVYKIGALNEQENYTVTVVRGTLDQSFTLTVLLKVDGVKETAFRTFTVEVKKQAENPTPEPELKQEKINVVATKPADTVVLFEGVITQMTSHSAFVQDNTGGIHVRVDKAAIVKGSTTGKVGDKVVLKAKVLGDWDTPTVENMEAQSIEAGTLPNATVLTKANLAKSYNLLVKTENQGLKFKLNASGEFDGLVSSTSYKRYPATLDGELIYLSVAIKQEGHEEIEAFIEANKNRTFDVQNVVLHKSKITTDESANTFLITNKDMVVPFIKKVKVTCEWHYEEITDPVVEQIEVEEGKLTEIALKDREGYEFDTTNTGNILQGSAAEGLKLVRHYKLKVLSVEVHSNGGSPISGLYPQSVKWGKAIGEITASTKPGFDYVGIFEDELFTVPYEPTKIRKENVKLYLKFVVPEEAVLNNLVTIFNNLQTKKDEIDSTTAKLNLLPHERIEIASQNEIDTLKNYIYVDGDPTKGYNPKVLLFLAQLRVEGLNIREGGTEKPISSYTDKELLTLLLNKFKAIDPSLDIETSKVSDFNNKQITLNLTALTSYGHKKFGKVDIKFVRGWNAEEAAKEAAEDLLDKIAGADFNAGNLVKSEINKPDFKMTLFVNPNETTTTGQFVFNAGIINYSDLKTYIINLINAIKASKVEKIKIEDGTDLDVASLTAETLLKEVISKIKAKVSAISALANDQIPLTLLDSTEINIKVFATTTYGELQDHNVLLTFKNDTNKIGELLTAVFNQLKDLVPSEVELANVLKLEYDETTHTVKFVIFNSSTLYKDYVYMPGETSLTSQANKLFTALINALDLNHASDASGVAERLKTALEAQGKTIDTKLVDLNGMALSLLYKINSEHFEQEKNVQVTFETRMSTITISDPNVSVDSQEVLTGSEVTFNILNNTSDKRAKALKLNETLHELNGNSQIKLHITENVTATLVYEYNMQITLKETIDGITVFEDETEPHTYWAEENKPANFKDLPYWAEITNPAVKYKEVQDLENSNQVVPNTEVIARAYKLKAVYELASELGNYYTTEDKAVVSGRGVVVAKEAGTYKNKQNKIINTYKLYVVSSTGGVLAHFDESKNKDNYDLAKTMDLQDEVYVFGEWSKKYYNIQPEKLAKIKSGAVIPGSHEVTQPNDVQTLLGQLGKLSNAFLTKKDEVTVGKRANLEFEINGVKFAMTYNYVTASQKAVLDTLVINKKYTFDSAFIGYFGDALQFVGLDATVFNEQAVTDQDKVNVAKQELTFPTEVHKNEIIQLPATGTTFTEVAISYTYDPTDPSSLINISGNQATVLEVSSDTILKITATFTCGTVSETKEYQITIKPGAVASTFIDFTKNTEKGKKLTDDTLKKLINETCYTSGPKAEEITGTSDVYAGNGVGGISPDDPKMLKLGASKRQGKFTIKFSNNVAKIKVKFRRFNASNASKLKINGVSKAAAKEWQEEEFVLSSPSNTVTIENEAKQLVIESIEFFFS